MRRLQEENSHKILKRILPHSAILIAVFLYTIGGGYMFYAIEKPHRVSMEKHASSTTTNAPMCGHDTTLTTTHPTSSTTTKRNTATRTAGPEINGLLSWLAWNRGPKGNGTSGRSARDTRANLTNLNEGKVGEDYSEEEEDTEEYTKKCNRRSLSSTVQSARKECLAAINVARTGASEFQAHHCASLLSTLHQCIYAPWFHLEDGPEQSTMAPLPTYGSRIRKAENLSVSSYIFMAFTVISTIGYGHVAPISTWGRVFCVVYGVVGIPLALLAIADQGRFLSAAVMHIYKRVKEKIQQRYWLRRRRNATTMIEGNSDSDEESMPALLLLLLFGAYMLIGGALLTPYESEWSFVDSVYFTFISSSSIGFGDLLPQEGPYLPITLLYVALGLALSTAAIDVFAGYLRRLHHWGRKIRNCANKLIWFGGKHVTLAQLVRNIGVQLGVPEEKINQLVEHFDEVVETTIEQVESGEKQTMVTAPLMNGQVEKDRLPADGIDFIDEKTDYDSLEEV